MYGGWATGALRQGSYNEIIFILYGLIMRIFCIALSGHGFAL